MSSKPALNSYDGMSEIKIEDNEFNQGDRNSSLQNAKTDSINNLYQLEELNDIKVVITDYRKIVTNIDTYLVFEIITQATREEYKDDEYKVERRYSDFDWLFNRLQEFHPMLIMPPIPGKHSLSQIERFSGLFIEHRKIGLEHFLQRVVCHPVLSSSQDVFVFLTYTKLQFQQYRSSNSLHSGRISRLLEDVQAAATSSPTSNIETEGSSGSPVIDKTLLNACRFGDIVGRMSRVSERIAGETEQWSQGMGFLADAFLEWAACESPSNAEVLVSVARACEGSEAASKKCAEVELNTITPRLHEYERYVINVKTAVRRRNKLLSESESLMTDINRCEHEINEGPYAKSPTTLTSLIRGKETVEQKQERLSQMRSRSGSLMDKISASTSDLENDMQRWDNIRHRDIRDVLKQLIDSQIEMHTECDESWRVACDAIKKLGQSTSSSY